MTSDEVGDDRDGGQAFNHVRLIEYHIISMSELMESCKLLEETALIRA